MVEPAEDMVASQVAPAAGPPPRVVAKLAGGIEPQLVWTNELGGLTYRVGERFVKYNPRTTGIDLDREVLRLQWLTKRHPAPRVLEVGADESAQWMVTEALPGNHAVGDHWRERSAEAIAAIAKGLRVLRRRPSRRVLRCIWSRPRLRTHRVLPSVMASRVLS